MGLASVAGHGGIRSCNGFCLRSHLFLFFVYVSISMCLSLALHEPRDISSQISPGQVSKPKS